MKFIDSIQSHKAMCPHCHHAEKFFDNLPTHGFMTDRIAVLFVYNEKTPCLSRIIKENIKKVKIYSVNFRMA